MENRSDYEKRLGEKLEAAYMLEDIGPGMSCEEFHRLIMAAEKKKRRRRSLLGLAAACVALCLMCGGFMAGMTMRESASAGKDDETKIVQQGDSVIIGSGASENNQNVGTSTKTYTDIEDIPEDLREQIHFLDSDEFELEKMKTVRNENFMSVILTYIVEDDEIVITEDFYKNEKRLKTVLKSNDNQFEYQGETIYEQYSGGYVYLSIYNEKEMINITIPQDIEMKKEAVLDDLFDFKTDLNM